MKWRLAPSTSVVIQGAADRAQLKWIRDLSISVKNKRQSSYSFRRSATAKTITVWLVNAASEVQCRYDRQNNTTLFYEPLLKEEFI
jgi:hypothetical protein